jgi:hypothetical protein
MNTNYTTKVITAVFLLVIVSTKLAASDIYHWVDENGVQHFSQYRPAGNIPDVSELQLEDSVVPANDQVEDVYNIEAHEKHMAEWREEREQKREDARERNRQVAQQPIKYTQPERDYSRSYWFPPIYNRPPHRPPHRPPVKPEPPVVLPSPPSTLLPRGDSG